MVNDVSKLDWSLMQAFVAVAETGSLSAAARLLRSSQPTLGRQIKALEQQLDAELFKRQSRGFDLTQTGSELVEPAKAMRSAMQDIALKAAGQRESLKGTVRITASDMLSTNQIPQIIRNIRIAEPDIQIELVPSDESRNLLYREADIAIRMYKPTQLDLVTRHVGGISIGVYAAKDYIARHGKPTFETFSKHDVVGYDTNPAILEGFKAVGIDAKREDFVVRCDDQNAYWELVRAGCGVGFSQTNIGDLDPVVERVDLGFEIPPLPMWLTAHEAIRQTPRIRRVWDLLLEGLKPLVA
jgi:DNA-binding transcriptional LysR family regulator